MYSQKMVALNMERNALGVCLKVATENLALAKSLRDRRAVKRATETILDLESAITAVDNLRTIQRWADEKK